MLSLTFALLGVVAVLTPSQRRLRAQMGAHAMHAKHDSRETSRAGREAFLARFYEGIPEDLPQAERDRRAEHARSEYFKRLAFKSSVARSKGSS